MRRVEAEKVSRRWMTRRDAAAYLGVSTDFIKGLNERGELGFSRVGGLVFIEVARLDRLIERGRVF